MPNSTRKMRIEDIPEVLAIERQSFSLPWTREMFEEELKQASSWREVAQTARGEVAGFLIGRSYPDAWHLMDIAVAPWARRRGVAAGLLQQFVRAADQAACPVFLEVRPRNGEALALYKKWGFSSVGSRKRYYSDTGEDALVMMRPVGNKEPEPAEEETGEEW
jgi:[ribosomal protein S18]-alanine N-acetyltransferase